MKMFSELRRILISRYAIICFFLCGLLVVHADKPVRNVKVIMLNKTYKVSGVSTVGELQLRIQQKTGLDPLKQGRVMFGSRRLSPMDDLRHVGVSDGSRIQLLPTNKVLSKERLKRLLEYATNSLGQVEFRMSIDYVWDVLKVMQSIINSDEFQEFMTDPTEFLDYAEEFRQKLQENKEILSALEEESLETTDPNVAALVKGLNNPKEWKEFVLKYLEVFRTLDLNSPKMKAIKQLTTEAYEKGMEMLKDKDFRAYIKGEDPEFYDFLQENLDDFDFE